MISEFLAHCVNDRYSAFVLFVLICGYFVQNYSRFIFSVAEIPFLDYSSLEYGLLAGPFFNIAYTITGVVSGRWIQKKRVLVLAMVMGASSLLVASVSLTSKFWQIASVTILMGATMAGYVPLSSNIIGDYFPLQLRGAAMGLFNIGLFAGYGYALGVGKWFFELYSWQWSYLIPAFLGCGLAMVILEGVKEPPARQLSIEKALEYGEPPEGVTDALRYWVQMPSLFLLSLAGGIRNAAGYCWAYYAAQFYSALFTKDVNSHCSYSYNYNWPGPQDCSSAYPYCIDGYCQAITDTPWHGNGMDSDKFESWITWVVFIGGTCGSVLGGLLSDRFAKKEGTASRVMVVAILTFCAVPCAYGALNFSYPWCFISLLCTYSLSECWLGILLATVIELVPKRISVTSVAIYIFIVSNVGGNAALLVPIVKNLFDEYSVYDFLAAPGFGDQLYSDVNEITYQVSQVGSAGLEKTLLLLWPGLFFLSTGLFAVAYQGIRGDIDKKDLEYDCREVKYGVLSNGEDTSLLPDNHQAPIDAVEL